MNFIKRMQAWGDTHHPKFMDIIRIVLGLFLCWRGYDYLNNTGELIGLMKSRAGFDSLMFMLIAHYIVFAHIVGGFLLAIGMLTRFACLIQIPILIGALFFVSTDTFKPYSELFLTVIVLLLLIYFLIAGNGPWAFKWPEEEKKRAERVQ